ncbi:hypothetical protein [Achromobacter insolitus]|uniref:hypothetical protein n=1 Tax=Achromobacter insolitus TaxID=217204 RepID=UPI0020A43BE7|nr:hypothetical protein [Achromobacter insolitus]MCP1404294.1 hypothetical protein [Achromobacter insolitus]
MKVTFYKPPFGRTEELEITKVRPEDAEYFERNGIRISMEEVGGMFAIYADTGAKTPDGEPDELIELSRGRSCEDTLQALRAACEATTVAGA